jgi:hypothetical protein
MDSGDDDVLRQARQQLAGCRARRRLLLVLLIQDLADSLIALQEIVGVTHTGLERIEGSPKHVGSCQVQLYGAPTKQTYPDSELLSSP